MSLSDHVTITITADTLGVAKAGFGVPMLLSANAVFAERIRYYDDLAGVAVDFPVTTSPEYLAASAIFGQSPHPEQIAIGRAIGKPTQIYTLSITAVSSGASYVLNVEGQGATDTTITYTPGADLVFTTTHGSELFTTVAHGMSTGDGPFRVSSDTTLPSGLAVDTNYWIAKLSADTYHLCATRADALTDTEVLIGSDGTGVHTLRRLQNDVICAQLVQGLNAVVGNNYLAAQVTGAGETDTITVTGDAAGSWFSVEVADVSLMKIAQTHVEPATTFATDIAAIANENDDWYALYTFYNSEPCVKAAAAAIEPLKKLYFADLSQSETVTLAAAGTGSSDCADDLATLEYDRTIANYHPSPASMSGAAWLGTRLHTDPGSETWKFAAPSGVLPVTLTATHKINLRAKNCNVLQSIGGTSRFWDGKVVSGEFIDVVRGLDWLENDMQVSVYNALAGALKVPFTDAGIALIQNEVLGSLGRGIAQGLLAANPKPVCTVPLATAVSTANKGIRTLPDVKFSATLAGAIHKITITGVVSL